MNGFLSNGLRPKSSLTNREIEVLRLICDECSNKDIAKKLGIAIKTVEYHKANIYEKIGVTSAVGAVRFAIRKGHIDA